MTARFLITSRFADCPTQRFTIRKTEQCGHPISWDASCVMRVGQARFLTTLSLATSRRCAPRLTRRGGVGSAASARIGIVQLWRRSVRPSNTVGSLVAPELYEPCTRRRIFKTRSLVSASRETRSVSSASAPRLLCVCVCVQERLLFWNGSERVGTRCCRAVYECITMLRRRTHWQLPRGHVLNYYPGDATLRVRKLL